MRSNAIKLQWLILSISVLSLVLFSVISQVLPFGLIVNIVIMIALAALLWVFLYITGFKPLFNYKKQLNAINQHLFARSDDSGISELSDYVFTMDSILADAADNFHKNEAYAVTNSEIVGKSVYHTTRISGDLRVMLEEMENLSSAINQSTAATEEISKTVQQFDGNIDMQSSAVLQTSSSVEEMSASIRNIAKITHQKQERINELAKLSAEGEEKIELSKNLIDDINKFIGSMEEVISVINNIAAQTNLLAMNAAIEAAHAGEAGKGFAVVAEEIRKLSSSTTENSKAIASTLKSIIEKINNISDAESENFEFFKQIKSEIGQLSDALEEIIHSNDELAGGSDEILTAVKSLIDLSELTRTGSKEITLSINEIMEALQSLQNVGNISVDHIDKISSGTSEINAIFKEMTESNINSGQIIKSIQAAIDEKASSLNLPVVILQHFLWLLKVRLFMDDKLDIDTNTVGDHTKCDLGKWMDRKATDKMKKNTEFSILEKYHTSLHDKVIFIFNNKANTDRKTLEDEFNNLLEISETVVKNLRIINDMT